MFPSHWLCHPPLAWSMKSKKGLHSLNFPLKKEAFLKPPDTAPTYFLPPHPPDTHSREGVQLPCVRFFYILFLDRPLAWLKSKAENVCPILPFGKCPPGETRRCHTALDNRPGG